MSGFELNFYSASKDFHRYSTDDFALLEIGVGNFNVSSLAKFLNLRFLNGTFQSTGRPVNPDIREFFNSDPAELANTLVGVNSVGEMEILAFDEEDKVYKLKRTFAEIVRLNPNRYKPADYQQPPSTLNQFLQGWNNVQLGAEPNEKLAEGYKVVVNRIQNSLSGCILYGVDLNILGTSRKSQMRLSFLNTRDNESSKTISFNGSPFISAIPQDAIGMKYGRKNTDNAPPGVYSTASKGAGNPEDMVGGQMRLAYDPATKTWESGTQQVLARLVDDIDGVNIPELSPEEMLSISANATYDTPPEDNPWMGKANSGRAIPLSTEDGNPNLYGPNFKGGCENTSDKAMVRAVNRSNKSFKSGRLVVLSFINGEWLIVGGEGDEIDGSNIRFGNFEYQQYVIPAKYFFAVPNSSQRITPQIFEKKFRYWRYLFAEDPVGQYFSPYVERGIMDPSSANGEWTQTVTLNLLASQIPSSVDPIQYLLDKILDKELIDNILKEARENAKSIVSDISFDISKYYGEMLGYDSLPTSDKIYRYYLPYKEQVFPVPKNMLVRSAASLLLNIPTIDFTDEDRPNRWQVPLFWGALFPDGYRAGQVAPFLADEQTELKIGEIYKSDPNLKEFSMYAGMSLPFFRNEEDLWRYIEKNNVRLDISPEYARKTGVVFPFSGEFVFDDRVIRDQGTVFGLEPIQPKRIQFTPMSLDFLHTPSIIENTLFSYLRSSLEIMNSQLTVGNKTFSFNDYGKFLWGIIQDTNIDFAYTALKDFYFIDNAYYLKIMDYVTAYDLRPSATTPTLIRHAAPIGTPNGSNVLPNFPLGGGFQRSPVMPVIAIKSTIRTSSEGLRFTTNQRFGYVQQTTVLGGDAPQVTILGPFLAWNVPGTPVSTRAFPQWGDRSGRETYDSFGTTGLHIRVFEHWSPKDTDYLGAIFSPLHFNDRFQLAGSIIKRSWNAERNTWEIVKNQEGLDVLIMSPLDFREPTLKTATGGGNILAVGAPVTEQNLANFSNWKYNFVRRDRLLSGGGFAYIRRAIFVSNASLDPAGLQAAGGSGYSVGDKFVYQDGYTLEVTAVGTVTLPDGKVLEKSITGLKGEANFANGFVKNINSYGSDIRSVSNVRPQYIGSGGTGAILKANSFVIGRLIGYDPPPKEVVPITRITKPSNRGEGRAEGSLGTSVIFEDTNKKEFDIFYFFQNDPATYALNGTFDDADAHYVISEVDPL
jgi:hypothetical protein